MIIEYRPRSEEEQRPQLPAPVVATVQGLPSLVAKAATQLASAKSAAEVLDARDMAGVAYDASKKAARLAKAKDAHDEIIAKAHRAQADALEIEAAAKRRLADEYDAAQERGEIRSNGETSFSSPEKLGGSEILPPKELHEARQIRDAERADPGVVKRTLEARLVAGQEPTKAALREAVKEALAPHDDLTVEEIEADPGIQRAVAALVNAKALVDEVAAMPAAEPMTPDREAHLARVFGSSEDRQNVMKILNAVQLIEGLPSPDVMVTSVPPTVDHVVDVIAILKSATWLENFARAWERRKGAAA